MNRDDKLRELAQEILLDSNALGRCGESDVLRMKMRAWADRIESALGETSKTIPAELKESIEYMDEERKSCGHRHMHLYTKDFDALRAWIRQVTGE